MPAGGIMKRRELLAVPCLLLLLLALAAFPEVQADAAAWQDVDYSRVGAGLASELYDNNNGLPAADANAIAQTSDGYIWIGSYSGLVRYNGNEFYRIDPSYGISNVVSLFVDSKDRLWIGTNDHTFAFYENGEFTTYDQVEGLKATSIRDIIEDDKGNIIIAMTQGLAYVDQKNAAHVIDEPQVNEQYIESLEAGPDGVIYGVTNSGACFTIEDLRVTSFFSFEESMDESISCITKDTRQGGGVVLGTYGSVLYLGDPAEGIRKMERVDVSPLSAINCIREAKGRLWICADDGIGYLEEGKGFVQVQNLPMNNSVDSMMEDYEGNLWFASSRQGLMKLVENQFRDLNVCAGLPATVVNSTCLVGKDLYIGADDGLYLVRIEGENKYRKKENGLTKMLSGIRVRCIKQDSRGNLWMATYSDYGLVRYSPDGKIRTFSEDDGIGANRVRTMLELSDGSIAVSSNGGVDIIKGNRVTEHYNASSGISNTVILSIQEDTEGRLYLGSDGNGIYIVERGKQNIKRIGVEDGLTSGVVMQIKKDPVEGFWIVTGSSIAYYDGKHVKTVSTFPYSNNLDIYFDQLQQLWVIAGNGIYVVDREAMLAGCEGEKIDYTLYDTKCGLPSLGTANARSFLDESGILYLSGNTGVYTVNINHPVDDAGGIRISVPMVEADGMQLVPDERGTVEIPAGCKRLVINPLAATYSLKNPKMSYMLTGFDDEENFVNRRELEPVTYTNLDGGKYVFHLSMISSKTGVEADSSELVIIKERAFYEYIWFYVFLVIVMALVVAGCVRLYLRRRLAVLEAKEHEKSEFIDQIITAFAKIIDMKDRYTNGHSFRVAKYTKWMAQRLAPQLHYTKEDIGKIYNTALLHDIGKISIPDAILKKPAGLTEEEYAIMKSHSQNGYEILKEIRVSPDLALGAGYHHERLDGKGYPKGLKGDEIPMVAQIIAVADTFDAMYSTRPYRKKMQLSVAMEEIQRIAGTQLNPDVVKVFVQLCEEGKFDSE